MKAALENFWYHYKIPVLLAAAILVAGSYLLAQQLKTVPADYEVALVSSEYYLDEQLAALQEVLTAAGKDTNGDGSIVVAVHRYRLKIGADGQDSVEIGALDADLVGNRSGLFLLEDPPAFEEATNGICRASEAIPCTEIKTLSGGGWSDLSAVVRENADEKYAVMLSALTA